MVKRKLKGTNVDKLKPEQKAKMEKTLERMDKIVNEDSVRLRTKAETSIKDYENRLRILTQQIEDAKIKKLRIEGAIYSLKELLTNDSEAKS